MINVELKKGPRVEEVLHRNQWELVVEYMHGDADAYTKQNFFYTVGEEEELKKDLYVLNQDFPWEYRQQKKLLERINEKIYYDVDRFFDIFSTGDVTNEGGEPAQFESIELFWYDAYGARHKANAVITETV